MQLTENTKIWLAALRSGEFTQTGGQLAKGDNERCCLGVACDVSGQGEWRGDDYVIDVIDESGMRYRSRMPSAVAEWLFGEGWHRLPFIPRGTAGGVDINTTPEFPHGGKRLLASDLNDTGTEFPEIADAIEEVIKLA